MKRVGTLCNQETHLLVQQIVELLEKRIVKRNKSSILITSLIFSHAVVCRIVTMQWHELLQPLIGVVVRSSFPCKKIKLEPYPLVHCM
jgi:hypothetical protein